MKRQSKFTWFYKVPFVILISTLFIFFSCEKDKSSTVETQTEERSISVVEDDTYASETFDEVQDVTDEAADQKKLKSTQGVVESSIITDCATVTIEGDSLETIMTVDFGTENCECEDGRYRRGEIIAVYSGDYWNDSATISYSFDNYFVDDNQVTGTKTITRFNNNDNGNRGSHTVVDGTIILSNNEGTITWNSERSREVIQGTGTLRRTDDIYQLTGTSEGVSRDGESFSTEIKSPLVRKLDFGCRRNYVEGILDINQADGDELSIDYGNGACNRWATVTLNGRTYKVYLR